jgi:hypothetical protein
MRLTVTWEGGVDSALNDPNFLIWEDGRQGTLSEYDEHYWDTRSCSWNESGNDQMHLFTDIVATVKYDRVSGAWAVNGTGVTPAGLYLTDPLATDHQILMALYTLPIVYRPKIVR